MRALRFTACPAGRRVAQAAPARLSPRTATATTTARLAAGSSSSSSSSANAAAAAPSSSSASASARAAIPPLAPVRRPRNRRRPLPTPPRSVDYVASAADEGVLGLPPRTELTPADLSQVFGYPRDLTGRYYLGRVLGAGSFGVVREAIAVGSGRRHAVKTIPKAPKRGPATPRYLLKLRAEIEVMRQLGTSLNAVHLREALEDDSAVHLVMELCEGGALLERVARRAHSEASIARIVRAILRFIAQCHAKNIVYRDVKPDNFLFLSADESAPLKATDFGLAIRHAPHEPKLTSRSGTPAYMAPELVMQCYDEKADLWSVGMLAYQLLTGRFPFWDDVREETLADVWKAVLSAPIDWAAPELEALSPSARDLLERLLQRNPVMRPSAAEALEHDWLREGSGLAADSPLAGSVVQRLQRYATYAHLKQVVLRLITEQMRQAGRLPGVARALRDLFARLDLDGNGELSVDELIAGLREEGYMVNESEVRQLMSAIDLNRDGSLQDSEFLATMIDWPSVMREAGEGDGEGSEWASYVAAAFSRLDRDGDGFIDLEELLAELPPVYFSPASASASSVNSMGSPGASPASSRDGGAAGAAAAAAGGEPGAPFEEAERERVAEAKRMLREADEDGDGRISRQEFSNLLRHSIPDELTLYDSRLGTSPDATADGGDTSDGGGADPVARAAAAAAKAAAAAAKAVHEGFPSDARR